MATSTVHRAAELSGHLRDSVEQLLGRRLAEDELVTVTASSGGVVQPAPTGPARAHAFRLLRESLERMDERVAGWSEQEIEDTLDEALREVRPSYRPIR